MIKHLYTLTWNEADILGFFFRHYDPWIDRYVVYDNGSSDETLALLRAHPRVEIRSFEWTNPNSFVWSHWRMQDSVWKESRSCADWVIITATDEHLHVPGMSMQDYLEDCRKRYVTLIPAMGYQMVSEEFPCANERLCVTRTLGVPDSDFNKISIFDPNAISEINYSRGRHRASPSGRLKLPPCDRLLLLHYKHLGLERTFARYRQLHAALRAGDLVQKSNWRYSWSRERFMQEWQRLTYHSFDISAPGMKHWKQHLTTRYWRRAYLLSQLSHLVPGAIKKVLKKHLFAERGTD
ncbi:MAG TPA: glycosyltransferase family 2 protein [Thermodesulfovibrionales bacterium]|nr:glycosyltransferase family 2 protein [Thermodesulfovibrionales bacterium]